MITKIVLYELVITRISIFIQAKIIKDILIGQYNILDAVVMV